MEEPNFWKKTDDFSKNPFSGISSPTKTTFWEKCKETFFVFSGNLKKQGLVLSFLNTSAPDAIVTVILCIALSPLLLFVGPFLYMLFTAFTKKEKDSTTYPAWAWALAGFWALPVLITIVVGLVATALGLGAAGLGIAVGIVAAALAIGFAVVVAALPAIPFLFLSDKYFTKKQNSPWWQWALTIIPALPLIAGAFALVVSLVVLITAMGVAIAITSFILTFASMPLIAMVHAFGGQTPKDHTTLWRSTLLNPSTWIMIAIGATGISLLIQGIDPLTFAHAAGPLIIIQTVFASMATVAVLGALFYGTYCIGRWIYYPHNKLSDEPNYITKYLNERWTWAKNHLIPAGVVWGLGALGLIVVVGLTIDYFTGGALFGSLMAPVFEFMAHGFLFSIHSIFGLGFLGSLSDATLLLIGQIVSAITLISVAVFVPDNVSRFLEAMTTVDEAVLADRFINENFDSVVETSDGLQGKGHSISTYERKETGASYRKLYQDESSEESSDDNQAHTLFPNTKTEKNSS